MMRAATAFVVVATALVVTACHGNTVTGPTGSSTVVTQPAPQPGPTPTAEPSTPGVVFGAPPVFGVVYSNDMSVPPANLQPWTIRRSTVEQLKRLVFCDNAGMDQYTANPGIRPLWRLGGPVSFVYDPNVFGPDKQDVFNALPRDMTSFDVSVGPEARPGSTVFKLALKADIEPRAQAPISISSSGIITGGEIQFKSFAFVTKAIFFHEAGHAFGACHENEEPTDRVLGEGVMSGRLADLNLNNPRFRSDEIDAIRQMYNAPPGVLFPDDGNTSGLRRSSVGGGDRKVIVID